MSNNCLTKQGTVLCICIVELWLVTKPCVQQYCGTGCTRFGEKTMPQKKWICDMLECVLPDPTIGADAHTSSHHPKPSAAVW